jgi:hypothetical protein
MRTDILMFSEAFISNVQPISRRNPPVIGNIIHIYESKYQAQSSQLSV